MKHEKVYTLVKEWGRLFRGGKLEAAYMARLELIKELKANFNDYPSDLIIESLSYAGGGPCIISDQRGGGFYAQEESWSDDYNPEDNTRQYVIQVEESGPQLTIKAALKLYLDNLKF